MNSRGRQQKMSNAGEFASLNLSQIESFRSKKSGPRKVNIFLP